MIHADLFTFLVLGFKPAADFDKMPREEVKGFITITRADGDWNARGVTENRVRQ